MTATTTAAARDGFRPRALLNKVPEVTIWFWIIKVLCTRVGESFADWINMSLGVGLERLAQPGQGGRVLTAGHRDEGEHDQLLAPLTARMQNRNKANADEDDVPLPTPRAGRRG